MKTWLLQRIGGLLAVVSAVGCADKFPLPEAFDAAFVTGNVCMPSKVRTGATGDAPPSEYAYPVRFETCLYRCITLDPKVKPSVQYAWSCALGQCQMMLLAMAHVLRVPTEEDCDGRDLPAPSDSECTPHTVNFSLSPPCSGNDCSQGYFKGDMPVTVPYLTLEQAQAVTARVQKGESLTAVALDEVGLQNYPARQFGVNFDPANTAVDVKAPVFAEADCHDIKAPAQ